MVGRKWLENDFWVLEVKYVPTDQVTLYHDFSVGGKKKRLNGTSSSKLKWLLIKSLYIYIMIIILYWFLVKIKWSN